jgi:hypothetical protein
MGYINAAMIKSLLTQGDSYSYRVLEPVIYSSVV